MHSEAINMSIFYFKKAALCAYLLHLASSLFHITFSIKIYFSLSAYIIFYPKFMDVC
jgi:hypothetical protein